MTFNGLDDCPGADGVKLDLPGISRRLWTCMGPRLGDDICSRRTQLAGGEENNGLELWRRYHEDNIGMDETIEDAGLLQLHRFDPIKTEQALPMGIAEWERLFNRF